MGEKPILLAVKAVHTPRFSVDTLSLILTHTHAECRTYRSGGSDATHPGSKIGTERVKSSGVGHIVH